MDEKLYQEVLQGCLECIRAWKEEKGGVLPIQWGDYVTHCWNYGGSDLHNAIDALVAGLDDDSEAEELSAPALRLVPCANGRRVKRLASHSDVTEAIAVEVDFAEEHIVDFVEAYFY